jgi:serine/threonine protein kinase
VRGKYRLDAALGVGGMAVIYAATHRNKKRFAVKTLYPDLSLRPEIRVRFLRPSLSRSRSATGCSTCSRPLTPTASCIAT